MSESPSKRHKKHKKHKKKRAPVAGGTVDDGEILDVMETKYEPDIDGDDDDEDDDDDDIDVDVTSPPLKLTIKLGGRDTNASNEEENDSWPEEQVRGEDVFVTKKAGDDTSDEEREWLNALEAGTLDDSGAVKKMPDMTLMTARQRARISGKPEEPMMQLPSGYKTTELTEEQLQRRQLKAKKRREQAMEKQEKDKKQTLDRLLKKQQSKLKTGKERGGSRKTRAPSFRYISSRSVTGISVPQGYQFPFPPQKAKSLPRSPVLCYTQGCSNLKKYSCSKTGVPLCSLECYKLNLQNRPQLVT